MYKPLPIGVESFKELITQGYYYVDKTLFIKELIDLSLIHISLKTYLFLCIGGSFLLIIPETTGKHNIDI